MKPAAKNKLNWGERLKLAAQVLFGKGNIRNIVPRMFSGYSGVQQSTQFDYTNASDEGYKSIIWVYRCVQEIANRVSSVPWGVFKKNAKGENIELTNHSLNQLLLYPNEEMSWKDFLEWWVIYMFVSGNAYVVKGRSKKLNGLTFLRPDRIKIEPDSRGDVKNYAYKVNGVDYNIDPRDMTHFKFPDPTDDYYGLSPIFVAARTCETELDALKWNRNLLRNEARPGGALKTQDELSDDAYNKLKTSIQEMQGTTHAGKPMILEGGLDWVRMSLTQQEADFIALKKLNREEICAAMGVPPVIVGVLDHATYSNFEQAERSFWNQTIMPTLRKFRDRFNVSIAAGFGEGIFIDYVLDHIEALQESQDNLHKRIRDDFRSGLLSQNEAREMIGYEKIKNGNFYIFAGSYQLLGGEDVSQFSEMTDAATNQSNNEANNGTTNQENNNEETSLNIDEENDEDNDTANDTAKKQANSKSIIKPSSLRIKVVNLSSARAQEEYKNSVEKRRVKWEKAAKKEAESLLTTHYKLLAKGYKKEGQIETVFENYKYDFLKSWDTFYTAHYENVIDDFGRFTEVGLEQGLKGKFWTPDIERKADTRFDLYDEILQRVIENAVGEKIVQVNDFTLRQVKLWIWESIREGLTISEVAQIILDNTEIASIIRADRIAATETVFASNAGSYYSAQQTGNRYGITKDLTKSWLTAGDERVRSSHKDASGQTVPMDAPFQLSGGQLMFPGDSSLGADADEIILCRCTQSYNTDKVGGLVGEGTTVRDLE